MSKPLTIAHIMGKWVGGGVESVVMNYYRHINRENIQFDFICDDDSTNIPYDEITKLGGRVLIIAGYQKLFQYQKELYQLLKNNHYQIIHSHINTMSVFPLRIAKKVNVPIRIAHSHSTTNKKEVKKNLMKQLLRLLSKVYANEYMCCSEYAGRWLFGKKFYDQEKVYLLNNAIDLNKFIYNEAIREQKRKEWNFNKDTIVIGHVGRFVEQKNHGFLIDIFYEIHQLNPNSVLLLAGQGPLLAKMQKKVLQLGLENSVFFLGQRTDIHELYQSFDVFLLPSLYEGLPVVGVEAQASGLLCVFSDNMTQETKVLNSTIFLSLQDDEKKWAKELLNRQKEFVRKNTEKELSMNHFNIVQEASLLEQKYNDYILQRKLLK